MATIGVIYGSTRVTGIPTFWTDGYRTPTFQDEKVKNLLSPAVNRGDLQRLNYNQNLFLAPLGELTVLFQTPESDEEDTSSPFSSPLASRTKVASFSFWIGTPLFRLKLRPLRLVKYKVIIYTANKCNKNMAYREKPIFLWLPEVGWRPRWGWVARGRNSSQLHELKQK